MPRSQEDSPGPNSKEPIPQSSVVPWRQTFSALKYPSFRILWTSSFFSSGGNWVQQVTLGWLAYNLSGSAVQVSIVMGLRALPLLMAPITGVTADRFDRRMVLILNQAGLAILALGFAVIVLMDRHELWHLYVFSASTGIVWSFNNPVRQSLTATSVPQASIMNAVALNSLAFSSNRILGPTAGGFLIAFFGPGVNFLIQAALYVCVLLLVIRFRPMRHTDYKATNRTASAFSNLKEGLRYVANDRTVLTVILVALVPALTMTSFIITLMPVYAGEILGDTDGRILGILMASSGLGGIIGTLVVATFSTTPHKGRLVTIAIFMGGIGLIALSQVNTLWLACVTIVFVNMFLMTNMTTNNSILHSVAPDSMRGRVLGVYAMDMGMMPLGGVIVGLIADSVGIDTALLIGSVTGVVLVTLITVWNPAFKRLQI